MDTDEARKIVETKTVRCNRCGGRDGYYYWGGTVNGVPRYRGVCFKCNGYCRVEASRREIIAAERALGLRPPAKPRKPREQATAPALDPFVPFNDAVPF